VCLRLIQWLDSAVHCGLFKVPPVAMTQLPSTTRLRVRWMLSGVLAGAVIGGGTTWWLMRRKAEAEARQMVRSMEQAAGPRVPPRPGRLGSPKRSETAVPGGVDVPVTDDLRHAVRALMRIEAAGERQAALERLMRRLDATRWVELWVAFERIGQGGEFEDFPGGFGRSQAMMEEMFAQMALLDPQGALGVLRKEAAEGSDADVVKMLIRGQGFNKVLAHWAAQDLPSALAFHRGLVAADPNAPGADILVRAYLQVEPESALAWAADFASDGLALGVHQGIAALARRDPARARDLLLSDFWPDSFLSSRRSAALALANDWAEQNPEAAFDWARRLPSEIRASGLDGAMRAWLQADATAALDTLSALPATERSGAINAAVGTVTQENVAVIMGLVAEMPDGIGGDTRSLADAAQQYRQWFPEQAADWLQSLPPGSMRDSAIQGFVGGELSESDPEAAASWSAAASDPALRASLLDSALTVWSFHYPAEARQWLESTNRLSELDRARLIKQVGP
jgi:hypothetical protein